MNAFFRSCFRGALKGLLRLIGGIFLVLFITAVVVWFATRPKSQLELANEAASYNQRMAQIERIKPARDYFIIQMSKVEGVQSTKISEAGDVVIVRFAPLAHISKDHVRVLCEGVAYKWAAAAGLSFVRCESWYGNKMYTSGNYDGPVPADFEARQLRKSLVGMPAVQENQAQIEQADARIKRLLELRNEMEGKPYAAVVAMHGEPLSKDPVTGWAVWKDFKAMFQTGKAVTVRIAD
ncbi:hypothetical protein CCP3SC15_990008 [Gammaproteobacteria bacterium]